MANEKRLIDANELAKEYQFTEEYTSPLTPWTITDILNILDEAPTVDAVEVVRCKDCKFYMTIHCICDGCCISDDWYCAGGERRTDE